MDYPEERLKQLKIRGLRSICGKAIHPSLREVYLWREQQNSLRYYMLATAMPIHKILDYKGKKQPPAMLNVTNNPFYEASGKLEDTVAGLTKREEFMLLFYPLGPKKPPVLHLLNVVQLPVIVRYSEGVLYDRATPGEILTAAREIEDAITKYDARKRD